MRARPALAADLQKALQEPQEQQGEMIQLRELLLQRKLVSKKDLASALTEVSTVEYVDCQSLQPAADVLKLIPVTLAKRCRAIPIEADEKTITVTQTVNLARSRRPAIQDRPPGDPALRFSERGTPGDRPSLRRARRCTRRRSSRGRHYRMEFISSSSRERNIEAMHEMQLELRQKSKTTPAVHLVATKPCGRRRVLEITMTRCAPWRAITESNLCRSTPWNWCATA